MYHQGKRLDVIWAVAWEADRQSEERVATQCATTKHWDTRVDKNGLTPPLSIFVATV